LVGVDAAGTREFSPPTVANERRTIRKTGKEGSR